MTKGLNLWKNNNDNILTDADNLFWAIIPNRDKSDKSIPKDVISLYKKFKHRLSKEMYDFRFSKELTAIYIDPTDKCNANCPYCYIPPEIRQTGRSMTKDELNFILNKIAKYFSAKDNSTPDNKKRKQVIIFHAAEPLLVKDIIFEAISSYSKIFKFGLQTNALLLEKKDVEFLKKYRVGVGISLDSSLPSVNNKLRTDRQSGGNFSKAIRAIKWFDGYKGLNIITTITKFNVKNLPELVKFLHAQKIHCVLLNPIRLTQRYSYSLKPDEKNLTKYFIKAVDKAIELSINTKHKIIIGNFSNVILGIVAPVARRLMCDISPCGGGRCFFTITANGDIIPCGEFIGLKGFRGGNIFNTSIAKAMRSEPFKKIRARITEKISECNVCEFRNICGAPCPAELHSRGEMYQKSIFCNFYKQIIKYAFKLIAEDKLQYLLRNESINSFKYEYNLNPT